VPMEDLSRYLMPTFYIDYDSPSISRVVSELAGNHPREMARAVFNFVRDKIPYNPYSPFYRQEHYQASETLKRGEGFCVQKAVLLAALARASGIPARLVFADIRNHLMPPKLWNMMKTDLFAFHGYDELYIDGSWVKVTPTFDSAMCERLGLRVVEFDGHQQAVFHSHDLQGNLHIEYVNNHGVFDDLPFQTILNGFRHAYSEDMINRWMELSSHAGKNYNLQTEIKESRT
jgi:transglutaminase-like putative cysteine protease